MKSKTMIFLMLIGILLLSGCTAYSGLTSSSVALNTIETTNRQGTTYQISVEENTFRPADLEIKTMDTVEWINVDDNDHTVTFDGEEFDVALPMGGSATYQFTKPGIYTYSSQLNPLARGTILVKS